MFALILWFLTFNQGPELRISLSNIQQASGSIYVAVYDNEADYLNTDRIRDKKIVALNSAGSIDISFENLPEGTYAITCFHDENNNGKLDTNFMGIPTEPFGFSNNAKPQFGAPTWSQTKFRLKGQGETHAIRLVKW